MFKRKKVTAQPKRYEAKTDEILTTKSQEEAQLARGKVAVHIEQVGNCEPTLWISAVQGQSFVPSFSESRMYTFKDIDQLENFVLQLHQQVIAVRVGRAAQVGEA